MRSALLLVHLLLVAGCAGDAVRPTSAVRTYSVEQLMSTDNFQGLSFSPDNTKVLTSSARTGIGNVYVVPVDGGRAVQLTHSTTETISAVGYFPRDERILYTADQGGNELFHLYVRELDGSVRDLTPGAKVKAGFVAWAPDGRSFFATTTERDPRFFDLYEFKTDGYARTRLFENNDSYRYFAVSADRRYVVASRIYDNATTHADLYDRKTGKLRRLTSKNGSPLGPVNIFAPQGPVLYYTTDEGHEFQYLVRQNLETGERAVALKYDWDVAAARFSPDGRRLVVLVNEDARLRPHVYDAATLAEIPLTGLPDGSVKNGGRGFAIADGAASLAFVLEHGNAPGDIYLSDVRTGSATRLLRALPDEIAETDLVPGRVVRFASYDGVQVPGILYTPHQARSGAKLPAMIHIHGGPGDQSDIGFNPMLQYLVNHGYVVYAINNRGSSGSGKTFYHLDDHRHGDADLDDVVAAKGMLAATGYVDPQRIGIMGWSYGGFLTLAGLTFRPREFAVGVDIYGVSNWPRMLKMVPPWWVDLKRYLASEVGDPDTEADYLRRISPLFHADRIERPLLVLQGANDPRVTQAESDDIVKTVRANGVPVEYVVFPDEGHGFRKKANQIAAYQAIKDFLDKYLRGDKG